MQALAPPAPPRRTHDLLQACGAVLRIKQHSPFHNVVLLVGLAASVHKHVTARHSGRQAAARHLRMRQGSRPADEAGEQAWQ